MNKNLLNAIENNNIELAKTLITNGADVNQKDNSGNSLLIVSAAKGYAEMVELLLDAGADIQAVDASMQATALHAAAYLKHPQAMKILVERGIDIDAVGPFNGYTALHDAVWQNNIEGVSILIKGGANINIKGHDGNTPLDLAKKKKAQEIIAILTNS